MPFYKISEMEATRSSSGPAMAKSVPGELMKSGIVTDQAGEGPTPHFHPNEEQFMLMLEGRMNMVLGDEERIIEAGDLIHIPRGTRHGVIAVGGGAVFFAVKSPCGDGTLGQDYNRAADAEEVMARLRG